MQIQTKEEIFFESLGLFLGCCWDGLVLMFRAAVIAFVALGVIG